MVEHENWLTALFNRYLADVGNFFLGVAGRPPQEHPWSNYVVMQIVVVLFIFMIFGLLKRRLSADNPGPLQQIFEAIFTFLRGETSDVVGHHGSRYVAFVGTIFIFILFGNLLGTIPAFESPTMFPYVPVGCALAAFFYYHFVGIQALGPFKYLATFAGPIPLLAPLMVPIEILSHLSRVLSLSVRLFANMFAGEQITMIFLGLTYLIAPVIFMGLHIFVSLLQAYIFALLTMVYIAGAVAEHH